MCKEREKRRMLLNIYIFNFTLCSIVSLEIVLSNRNKVNDFSLSILDSQGKYRLCSRCCRCSYKLPNDCVMESISWPKLTGLARGADWPTPRVGLYWFPLQLKKRSQKIVLYWRNIEKKVFFWAPQRLLR